MIGLKDQSQPTKVKYRLVEDHLRVSLKPAASGLTSECGNDITESAKLSTLSSARQRLECHLIGSIRLG